VTRLLEVAVPHVETDPGLRRVVEVTREFEAVAQLPRKEAGVPVENAAGSSNGRGPSLELGLKAQTPRSESRTALCPEGLT
jgi:hypothetical protein